MGSFSVKAASLIIGLVCFQYSYSMMHMHSHAERPVSTSTYQNHPCKRNCTASSRPQICDYLFVIEWFSTMSRNCYGCPSKIEDCFREGCIPGTGNQRGVIVANRNLPGPSIEVCKNDVIRVKVINSLENQEAVSIHWHGFAQRKTPYMDGSGMFSQCPIMYGDNFTYTFEAEEAGTYFWHSHSGVQRGDGLAGPLIVREANDPHKSFYDKDDLRPVMLQDWYPHDTTISRFTTLNYATEFHFPSALLLNGISPTMGVEPDPDHIYSTLDSRELPLPAFEYRLNPQFRYRFRLINNAFFLTPMRLTIDSHEFIVIAADGKPVKPVAAKHITLLTAERFDIVPYFTGEKVASDGIYYMRFEQMGAINASQAETFAKIIYQNGTPTVRTASQITRVAGTDVIEEVNFWMFDNDPQDGSWWKLSDLQALEDENDSKRKKLKGTPDVKYVVEFDFEVVPDTRLLPLEIVRPDSIFGPVMATQRLNKILSTMPPVPILTQYDEIPKNLFCNEFNRSCGVQEYCQCIHAVDVPLGSLVEIILMDNGNSFQPHVIWHALHMHGYSFRVLAQEFVHDNLTKAELIEMDKQGKLRRNFDNMVEKDTVGVPVGGYVILRFIADNPGPWLFHCHFDIHQELGMFMLLMVGKPSQWVKPPANFPKCHMSVDQEFSRTTLPAFKDFQTVAVPLPANARI